MAPKFMAFRILFALTAVAISVGFAQVPSGKPNPTSSCNAIVSSLAEQADIASSIALPRVFAPQVLFGIGSALDGCSFESAMSPMLRAFEGARTLNVDAIASGGSDPKSSADKTLEADVRESRRKTLAAVISWLVSGADKQKRPDLIGVARDLAGQIFYKEKVIGRQEAFGPILNALLRKHDDDAVKRLLAEIEGADGLSPTTMLLAVMQSSPGEELKTTVLQRGYAAVEAGQCGLPSELRLIEKLSELQGRSQTANALRNCIRHRKSIEGPTPEDLIATQKAVELLLRLAPETASSYPRSELQPSPPVHAESIDPLPRAYEDIQILAEDSSAAVAMRVAQIPDPRTRQALLTSAQSALIAADKTDAAARVAAVISSTPLSDGSDQHPMELVMRARSTTTGDGLRAQVSHALSSAEKILAAENKAFSAAPNERERIRLYKESSEEAVGAYLYAAENALDLAYESAQRIGGPRRAEVLTMILTVACEKHAVGCEGGSLSKSER